MPAYRLANAAENDLVKIYRDSLQLFGINQADAYQDGLEHIFNFLAENPRAARLREELSPPTRGFRYKSHLVLYDIEADGSVLVVRVRHVREDLVRRK